MTEVSIFITPAERWEKIVELRDQFCDAKRRDEEIVGVHVADFMLDFIKDSAAPIRRALERIAEGEQ